MRSNDNLMNISRRKFIGGASASLFICGCQAKGPRKFAANERVNVGIIDRFLSCEYHNGWRLEA